MEAQERYETWLREAQDGEILTQLRQMDPDQIGDAFFQELSFGTGGLRGKLGAGTNRMNIYTVGKASQGLAQYVLGLNGHPSVAISYDSRIQSDRFALTAAAVFAANGIRVWLYPRLMPTPCLSYAVRALHCDAGVMITASHNPAAYNGYKVYGADGCQITQKAADAILDQIHGVDPFRDVRLTDAAAARKTGMIRDVPESVYDAFIRDVMAQSVLFGDSADRNVAIVYTPLNGTGLMPVTRILREAGFTNVTVVEAQRDPDGRFPTCPYPNPEIREAMELGLKTCEAAGADLLLATDPDCDRCGIAVRDGKDWRLLTGNETGLLLLDFICSQRLRHHAMPEHPVFVKTIVTMDLAEKIAASYGVETVNVLTGFKFIGEVIGRLEAEGQAEDYICGFEESYGYLTGSYVRDKDAVNASLLIAEMFAFYRSRGVTLPQKLEEIFSRFGYCMNTLHSYQLEGASGMARMAGIMADLRGGLSMAGGKKVLRCEDYSAGLNGLPGSDVLKFILEDSCSVVVRPSGTEPKLKIYLSVSASGREEAEKTEKSLLSGLEKRLQIP